jgi:hypothetical protein
VGEKAGCKLRLRRAARASSVSAMNVRISWPLLYALMGPWFEAWVGCLLRSESIRAICYLWKDVGSAEYKGYGGGVAEHYSVRTVALDGSVLLVQALADDVEVLFVMHVPHEP